MTVVTLEMVAAGEAEFRRRCGNSLPENKAECEAAAIAIYAAMRRAASGTLPRENAKRSRAKPSGPAPKADAQP